MAIKKSTRVHRRKTAANVWDLAQARGSIAHMLSESPGGIEGALERLKAAGAAGKEPSVAIALGRHEKSAKSESVADAHDQADQLASELLSHLSKLRLVYRTIQSTEWEHDLDLSAAVDQLAVSLEELDQLHNRVDLLSGSLYRISRQEGDAA
jgi:hypothetical protein